ncbi:MAG: hypothetical protein U0R64_01060 [Candidatus Nanopelagicales bacterium]
MASRPRNPAAPPASRRAAWAVMGMAAVTATLLTACSGDASTSDGASPSHSHITASTVNGMVPPGRPAKVIKSVLVSDTDNGDGTHTVVFRDSRAAGTRTPIHTHPYSGKTCLLKGQMTLYLEGADPSTARKGECYDMPSGLVMSGSNQGRRTAVFTDTFTIPQGESVWDVVEPGQEYIEDQFASATPSSSS